MSASVPPASAPLLAVIGRALRQPAVASLSDRQVHAVRKSVKRARAALRLLRPAMTAADYRRENAALRDLGRRFAPLRDARSLLDAFDAFASRHDDVLPAIEAAAFRQRLLAAHAQVRSELTRLTPSPHDGASPRNAFRACARRLDLEHAAPESLIEGLRRIYRKGRKTFAHTRRAPTTESLHEWRKQVKYLLNAAELLHDTGWHHLHRIARHADRIAGWLGDDHDLAMLHAAMGGATFDADTIAILNSRIASRRDTLQTRAFDRARKLYARKPKRFIARLEFED